MILTNAFLLELFTELKQAHPLHFAADYASPPAWARGLLGPK